MRRIGWVAAGLAVGIVLAQCGSKGGGDPTDQTTDPTTAPDAGDEGTADAGPDAATPGQPDAGPPPPPPEPVQRGGFTSYSTANRLPEYVINPETEKPASGVLDVSADAAGNVWVAGGDGLYLLQPGEKAFQRFTQAEGLQQWRVFSVAGLGADEVAVGYEGVWGALGDYDPTWMLESGGVDRVKRVGSLLQTRHYIMGTPPGVSGSYPDGRYKMRTVYIIRPGAGGDLWIGAEHGVGLIAGRNDKVYEHVHCAINACPPEGCYLLSGDWYGLAIPPDGSPWIGANHRVCRNPYDGYFTEAYENELDVWPSPNEEIRDNVQALAYDTEGALWIGSLTNGLARYRPTTGAFDYLADATASYPDGRAVAKPVKLAVRALAADPDGSLWVGTWVGILRRHPDGRWTYYTSLTSGLPSDSINSLQLDPRTSPRTLYIGTGAGVSIYRGP